MWMSLIGRRLGEILLNWRAFWSRVALERTQRRGYTENHGGNIEEQDVLESRCSGEDAEKRLHREPQREY